MTSLLDGARAGRSGVLVLRGEAGVGKSALLDDAREHAAGMTVLSACGIESEAQLPYAGLHQLVRPILGTVDRLPPPQARALRGALGLEEGAGDQWFLVSLAVLSVLAEAAEERPVLCLVDDAHWLDDGSAEAMVFAARRLEAEGIVMLFAARDGESRTFDAPGLPELRLGGLDLDAAGDLLDRHARSSLSAEVRERLIDGTRGNPLALLELASTLSEAQLATFEPLLEPLPVGERIERAFLSRVAELPEEAQTLLLVAAADESGSPATVLAAASALGAGPRALDAAETAGLLELREPQQLRFRHPLIRSAVYQAAAFSRRRAAHAALASVLTREADADRRAWHRAAAAVDPDASVAEELEQSARRAYRRSGFVPASLAFERAAVLTPDEHDRVRLLSAAVEGAWFGGRLERALTLIERARPFAADASERAELDRWRGLIEVSAGVPADARELLVRGATDMAAADPERALYMLSIACMASAYGGDTQAVPEIAAAGAGIPSSGSPVARFLASFLVGTGGFFGEEFETAGRDLRAALEQAEEADAAGSAALPGLLILAGGAALFLGDDRAADRFNRRLVTRTRETGAMTLLSETLPRLALSEVATGDWASADASLCDGVQLARQTGQHQVVAHMLAVRALIAGVRGEADDCRAFAAESRELASARRLVHVANTARWALLALELASGRPDEALVYAREIRELPIALWAMPERAEAAIRAGDDDSARSWLPGFEAWAAASGATWGTAAALRCRALLPENADVAEQLFTSALELADAHRRPYERARLEFAFGEHLRRSRRRVEAREHLRAALSQFEALGASRWAERAREELRASGQTARRREPSTRGDLTPQELQIARLVQQGLSNREVAAQLFLSPRTIDFHLRNVFRKLGITSRMQLVQLELGGSAQAREARRADPAITS